MVLLRMIMIIHTSLQNFWMVFFVIIMHAENDLKKITVHLKVHSKA